MIITVLSAYIVNYVDILLKLKINTLFHMILNSTITEITNRYGKLLADSTL